jgi:hypothetical protein
MSHTSSRIIQRSAIVLIIRDKALAAQYTQNWEAHRQHSQPYVGRGVVR